MSGTAAKAPPRIPQGMRDILPEKMIKRQYVLDVIRDVFEEFGFEPLQTPSIELSGTLKGKYGEDAERLIYDTTYGGGRSKEELSLRYDLSVPLSRVMAMYPELPRPFKRYQVAPVWRAERPQRGRYREFYQCDVDVVGTASMLADAEVINVVYRVLIRLGFGEFVIHLNNRKLLKGIGQFAGVPEALLGGLYRSIDKLAKIGPEGVERELKMVNLPEDDMMVLQRVARLYLQGKLPAESMRERAVEEGLPGEVAEKVTPPLLEVLSGVDREAIPPQEVQGESIRLVGEIADPLRAAYADRVGLIPDEVVERLLSLLQISGPDSRVLSDLKKQLAAYPIALEGIGELEEVIRYLEAMGVPGRFFKCDFAMVRGLEYYTGPIYETVVTEPNIGSITGGGRYDELIGMFMDTSYPATGTSFGIERIIDVMEEKEMFPPEVGRTVTEVLVAYFDEEVIEETLRLADSLRKAGLNVEMYFEPDPLREQIGYAGGKGIPLMAILGPEELSRDEVALKNLESREQVSVPIGAAADRLKGWLR